MRRLVHPAAAELWLSASTGAVPLQGSGCRSLALRAFVNKPYFFPALARSKSIGIRDWTFSERYARMPLMEFLLCLLPGKLPDHTLKRVTVTSHVHVFF
jgi:hypothetical protein